MDKVTIIIPSKIRVTITIIIIIIIIIIIQVNLAFWYKIKNLL